MSNSTTVDRLRAALARRRSERSGAASEHEPPPSRPLLAVVPFREREREDTGRGYVVRTAELHRDGSLVLAGPYKGAPIIRTFEASEGAQADRLAEQMSGLAPKRKIPRRAAAERI